MTAPPVEISRPPIPSSAWACGIALVTLLVYLPAAGGQFIWDDPDYVSGNLTLRSLHGLWQIWSQPSASPQYYPLVFSSFWLEYHVWGLHTFGYHAVNLLLHIGSALLIWRIMDQLDLPGGWLAAAIFALHPVNVESVAWISEWKNVLSTLLYLWATSVYLRNFTWRRWTCALLLFIAALLSKSVTATWPAAILVIFWWRDGRIAKRDVVRLLPFFAIALLSGAMTTYVEHAYVGASGTQIAELNFSPAERVLIAGRAVWFYAGKFVCPWPLSFIYPRWQLDVHSARQWAFPLLALLSCVVSAFLAVRLRLVTSAAYTGGRVRVRGATAQDEQTLQPNTLHPHPNPLPEGEGARRGAGGNVARGGLTAALLFIGTLFPALGFINVYPMRYSFVADHFCYLALPAIIVPLAYLLDRCAKRGSAAVLVPLAMLTFIRAFAFAGPLPLWSDTYAKNADSWMVCTNLANALIAQHQVDAAGDLYLRAYELSPELYETQTNASLVLARRNQSDRAIALLESSARLNPKFPFTFYDWGQILENTGNVDGAIEKYRHAIELAPEFPAAEQRLARLLAQHPSTQQSGHPARQ